MSVLERVADIWRVHDLRRKILITILLLAVCRVGVYVPVPGVDAAKIVEIAGQRSSAGEGGATEQVMNLLNMFSGGALGRVAVFGLGIMPYISASIIFTLLANVLPALERLRKEGAAGQKKLNQYTRLATVVLCLFQGILLLGAQSHELVPVLATGGFAAWRFVIGGAFVMMAGTMFLMWIGEQIDEHGIGNGISLIITINILSRLGPALIAAAGDLKNSQDRQGAVLGAIFLFALFVGIVAAVIYITRGERRIPVQQQKHVRGPRVYGGQKHYLPLRVNQAGVMPIIFGSALLTFPIILANAMLGNLSPGTFWHKVFGFIVAAVSPSGDLTFTYVMVFGSLIFFFCYFWTAVMFNPKEMSENLQSYGSFIPGIRPGRRTADYLEGIMNRVTLAGSFFLVVIAMLPMIVAAVTNVGRGISGFFGGTGILIVVGVTLDMVRRITDHLEMRRYSGFRAGAGGRRRSRNR
jgi:preprotein translocase subunit SecY